METLNIVLPQTRYPIHIGSTLLASDLLCQYLVGKQVLIVTNETIAPLYLQQCQQALSAYQVDTVILPDGEQYKTITSWQTILEALLSHQHHRNTTLISLGGGVIGDMTGFAASCYQRGVAFIQIPTSLLAQVDASIGGKTAVNHPLGKNMIGAFHQPVAVIIDLDTLATLSDSEFACGMAEVIKAAMIADPTFFDFLEQNTSQILARDQALLTQMIKRACEIKAQIVAKDEKESGPRALLNLGHTFAHALETVMGYGNIKHGEAVAIGLVCATRLSTLAKKIEPSAIDRLVHCLASYNLPTTLPPAADPAALQQAMKLDKKNWDDSIRLVLPLSIGQASITTDYPMELLQQVLKGASQA